MLRHSRLGVLAVTAVITGSVMVLRAGPLNPPAGPVASTYRTLDEVTPAWDKALPAASRFELVMGGAGVLDHETGLVWEQNPNTNFLTGSAAISLSFVKTVGGRRGWRLPTVQELESLVDPTQSNPALPAGHPFATPPSGWQTFFTSTQVFSNASNIYVVDLSTGAVPAGGTTVNNQSQVWLVRGGSSSDPLP